MFDKKTIIDIGKSLEEAENLEKTISELKLEKARIEKDIKIYSNSLKNEKDGLDIFLKEKTKIKEDAEKEILVLQAKRASLSSGMSSEVNKLNSLRDTIKGRQVSLDSREFDLSKKAELQSKEQKSINTKKLILEEIIKLASKL